MRGHRPPTKGVVSFLNTEKNNNTTSKLYPVDITTPERARERGGAIAFIS